MNGSPSSETAVISTTALSHGSPGSQAGCFLQSTDALMVDDVTSRENGTETRLGGLSDHHLGLQQHHPQDLSFFTHHHSQSSRNEMMHQLLQQEPQYDTSSREASGLSALVASSVQQQNDPTMMMMLMNFESPATPPQLSSDDENNNNNNVLSSNNATMGQLLHHSQGTMSPGESSLNDNSNNADSSALWNLGFGNGTIHGMLSQEGSPFDSPYSFRPDGRKRAASTSLADAHGKPRVRHQPDPCNSPNSSGLIALGTLATTASSPHLTGYCQQQEEHGTQLDNRLHHQKVFPVLTQAVPSQHLSANNFANTQQQTSIEGNNDTSISLPQHQLASTNATTVNSSNNGTNHGETTTSSTTSRSRCNANNPPASKRCRKTKQLDDQDIASPSDFESKSDIVAYVEQKLERMEESFTFKSATYQTHLKRFLPRPDEKHRKYIERIETFPRIPTSAAEQRELINLRKVQRGMTPDSRLGDSDGLTIKERLDEMLTSLVNKIMFLLVVKFDTWYIHAPAREQIREALLEFIWPDLPELHAFFREHFTLFIDMRIRHFRDSVARYFRDRPRTDTKAGVVNNTNQQQKQFKDSDSNRYNRTANHQSTAAASGVSPLLSVSSLQNSTNGYLANPVYTYGFVKALSNPTSATTTTSMNPPSAPYMTTQSSTSNYSLPLSQQQQQQQQYSTTQLYSSANHSSVPPITSGSPVIASPASESDDCIPQSPLHHLHRGSFSHSPDYSMIDPQQLLNAVNNANPNHMLGSSPTTGHDLLGNSDQLTDPGRTQNDFFDCSLSLVNDDLSGYPSRSLSIGDSSTTASPDALSSTSDISSSCCQLDPSNYAVNTSNASTGMTDQSSDFNSYFGASTSATSNSFLGNSSANNNLNDIAAAAVSLSVGTASPNFEQLSSSMHNNSSGGVPTMNSSSAPDLMYGHYLQQQSQMNAPSTDSRYGHQLQNRRRMSFGPNAHHSGDSGIKPEAYNETVMSQQSSMDYFGNGSNHHFPYQQQTTNQQQQYPPSYSFNNINPNSANHNNNTMLNNISNNITSQSTNNTFSIPSSTGPLRLLSPSLLQYRTQSSSPFISSTFNNINTLNQQSSADSSNVLGLSQISSLSTSDNSRMSTSAQSADNSSSCPIPRSNNKPPHYSPFLATIPALMPMTVQAAANSSSSNSHHTLHGSPPFLHSPSTIPCSPICPPKPDHNNSNDDTPPSSTYNNTSSFTQLLHPCSSTSSIQNRLPPQMTLHLDGHLHFNRRGFLDQYVSASTVPCSPSSPSVPPTQHQSIRHQQDFETNNLNDTSTHRTDRASTDGTNETFSQSPSQNRHQSLQ